MFVLPVDKDSMEEISKETRLHTHHLPAHTDCGQSLGYVYLPTVEVLCHEFMFVRDSRSSQVRGECQRHAVPLRPRSI